jgi:5-methylcytosine-specific restriction endonuclease McrA
MKIYKKDSFPKEIGKCKRCGGPIIAKDRTFVKKTRKFCSYKCNTSWRNSNTPKTKAQIEMIRRIGLAKKGKKDKLQTRLKKRDNNLGSKSHFWKGGLTGKNRLLRNSFESKEWRKQVYERDNYTCQICGIRSGKGIKVLLEADHIKPWFSHPELRFEISNGRTLCKSCHRKTDTFGKGNKFKRLK